MRRDPHAIAAFGRTAPAARMILGGVIEKGSAGGIRASLDEREISAAKEIAR